MAEPYKMAAEAEDHVLSGTIPKKHVPYVKFRYELEKKDGETFDDWLVRFIITCGHQQRIRECHNDAKQQHNDARDVEHLQQNVDMTKELEDL